MASDAHTPNPSDTPSSARPHEGLRDTLESIVVALILAFVFRAFILEAYVIPTGSMAHTLYGEHNSHVCTDCGFEYVYGRTRDKAQRLVPVDAKSACPNCGFLDETLASEYEATEGGDRILVLKWPFDIGGERLGPHRWEPTVFKDPSDGETNFIKRLVGLPNEVLEIIDGDVYAAPATSLKPDVREKLDRIRHLNHLRRTQALTDEDAFRANRELASLQQSILPELNACLRIQRKTADRTPAQKSLWTVVYDQDYLPTRPREVGWKPIEGGGTSGWNTSGRTITFQGRERPLQAIRLVGRPPGDVYAYNFDGARSGDGHRFVVADRRLRCLVTPLAGEGFCRLRMTKYGDEFIGELNVAEGVASLTMISQTSEGSARSTLIGAHRMTFAPGLPVRVELTNVDYRASLCIDGVEVAATTDATYAPNLAALRKRPLLRANEVIGTPLEPIAEIAAQGLDLELRHLVLERDVYYTNVPVSGEPESDRAPNRRNPFSSGGWDAGGGKFPGWGTEGNPILLREGEYFMLGDNSPQSKDSRMWWEVAPHLANRGEGYQIGTVPTDQLCGRAFFVYWPAGLRPASGVRVGLIPNVGRMRWIR